MTYWYQDWFNSPYYHVLYKERDDTEARFFLDNIMAMLDPAPGALILDQACGRGRHAVALNKMGYDVTGTDLSESNIDHCRRFRVEKLHFFVHDMRKPFRNGYFDLVFNIFTSMGYFGSDEEQQQVVQSAADALKAGGRYVIDFMNVTKVEKEMVESEEKEVNGIRFSIRRNMDDGFIKKHISFTDGGAAYAFEERVEAIALADFERYFAASSLRVKQVFGNYRLDPFDAAQSNRLIIVAEKPMAPGTE